MKTKMTTETKRHDAVKADEGLDRTATAFEDAHQAACNRWVLRYGDHLRGTERTSWDQGFEAGWLAAAKYLQESRED